MIADRYLPYPELVEDGPPAGAPPRGPYRIADSRGRRDLPSNGLVDLRSRRMAVPLDEAGRPVALHELAHVAWSPRALPEVDYPRSVLLAVEDARINLGLARLGLPVEVGRQGTERVLGLARRDRARREPGALVLRMLAGVGTSLERRLLAEAARLDPERAALAARLHRGVRAALEGAARRGAGPVAAFAVVERLAEEVASELALHGVPAPELSEARGGLAGAGADAGDDPAGAAGAGVAARLGRSGRLSVVQATLEVPVRGAPGRGGRVWGAGEEGSVLRAVHRLPVDRRVFRRGRRRAGGTVLVDTSGSMSLDAEDVERLLTAAPAGVEVAIYSGTGERGELRVVARGDRRAAGAGLEPFARGNVVDLPALEWLARRAAPRLWLSDGGVTGVDDCPHPQLTLRCRRLCRRARIRRLATLEEVARALAGRARS